MNFTDFAIDKILYKTFVSSKDSKIVLAKSANSIILTTEEQASLTFIPRLNGKLYLRADFSTQEVVNTFQVKVYQDNTLVGTFTNDVRQNFVTGFVDVRAFSKYTVKIHSSKELSSTTGRVEIRGDVADNYSKYISTV